MSTNTPPTTTVRFISNDGQLIEALGSADSFRRRYGADVSRHVDHAKDVVRQGLDFQARTAAPSPWIGYLTVDAAWNTVVGCCGFKGNPNSEGAVEIAYHTFPESVME